MKKFFATLMAALMIGAMLAGCGGSGDNRSSTGSAVEQKSSTSDLDEALSKYAEDERELNFSKYLTSVSLNGVNAVEHFNNFCDFATSDKSFDDNWKDQYLDYLDTVYKDFKNITDLDIPEGHESEAAGIISASTDAMVAIVGLQKIDPNTAAENTESVFESMDSIQKILSEALEDASAE